MDDPDVAADAAQSWLADLAAASTGGVRSADQAAHLEVARTERANIDTALAWCATHDPERGLQIATGFGWAWIVLGDSRGADRLRAALDAAPARHADALLLASWIEASTGDLALAREHIAAAQALADDPFAQAKCLYHLAYVVSHEGDFVEAIELTAQARSLYGDGGPAWDRAANALLRAARGDVGRRSRTSRRACGTRSNAASRSSTTRGCTRAARRCSASWPGSRAGSTTP